MRLLISGYYGAGNLGDEALLAGLLHGLAGRLRPVVASVDPAATRGLHGVEAVHRLHGLPGALLGSQALLSGGGGLLQDQSSSRSLSYYLGVIRAARLLGRRVVVFGQSLGPLSDEGRGRVQKALRGLPLALRDEASLDLARAMGLAARPVADAAMLLPRPDPGDRDGPLVLVPRAGYPGISELLVTAGRRHLAQGGRLAMALVHPGQDETEAARLRAGLPGIATLPADDPLGLVKALAGAHAVLSGRLHGLVLGAVAGSPVAGVAYDPKVRGFALRIGAPVVAAPGTQQAEQQEAAMAELSAFLSAPRLDAQAVAAERERAKTGIDWLLDDGLHAPPTRPA